MALKEKYLYQPTCNIAGFKAGYIGEGSKTVLPSYAMCKLGLRLVEDRMQTSPWSKSVNI